MLTHQINNNNETTSYPLARANTVYPDGLLTGLSIIVDSILESTVFLESVIISNNTVSILISKGTIESSSPLCYGSGVPSEDSSICLISESTGDRIGWATLGSMCNYDGKYAQKVPICHSCIISTETRDGTIGINGVHYKTPKELNIIVSGDTEVQDRTIKNTYDTHSPLYDSDSLFTIGPITSVNGKTPDDGVIRIKLPRGIDKNNQEIDLFKVDISSSGNNIVIASIKSIHSPHSETWSSFYAPFTCPDSDILLDKIDIHDMNINRMEAPLDTFIQWYRDEDSSSSSVTV